jgi:hypothetical protein
LLLESGGEAVAEELSAPVEQKSFAGIEDTSRRSVLGCLFQLRRQLHGHLGNLALQRRTGQQRRFRHFPSSFSLGNQGNLLLHPLQKCQESLTHPAAGWLVFSRLFSV